MGREEKTLLIRIPIRRDILSYRLLALNKNTSNKFSKVDNIQDRKKMAAGVRIGWATTDELAGQQQMNLKPIQPL